MDCYVCVRFVYVSGEAGNENPCILKMAIIAFFFVSGKTILKMCEFGLDHETNHDTIDDNIRRLKECIEAEKASCHDALLLSSMHVDTFNLYLAAKQVPQKNGNPFLFLSLIGSALPGVLASLDTTTIAKAFFPVRIIFLQLYE